MLKAIRKLRDAIDVMIDHATLAWHLEEISRATDRFIALPVGTKASNRALDRLAYHAHHASALKTAMKDRAK